MTQNTEHEYEIKDQWLTQNGKEIALLYGAGSENEIKHILKVLNNHDALISVLNDLLINKAIACNYVDKVETVLSQIDKEA
jgi:hypothetical protein